MPYVLYIVRHPAPGPPSHNGDLVSIDWGKENAVHAIVGSIAGHRYRLKPYETEDERPQRSATSLAKRASHHTLSVICVSLNEKGMWGLAV